MSLFLLVSALALLFIAPAAIAQAQIVAGHPDFVISSFVCTDRDIRFSWTNNVEQRLAHVADSLHGIGQSVPDSLKFGGYRLWRGETRDTSKMILLREFTMADTVSWTFVGSTRSFSDPDSIFEIKLVKTIVGFDSAFVRLRIKVDVPGPYNGTGYFYAVTYFDSTGTQRSSKADCFTSFPAHAVADQDRGLEKVWVVPNPYHGSAPWDVSEGRRIQFVNLPDNCKVSIFTVNGDLVRVLHHPDIGGYFNYGDFGGALNWNLKNENGKDVMPGVYIFYVEAPANETYQGHFVIIR